ncbi:MAG: hypothetical protein FWD96_05745 [Defluviitaleaceae bacterium]|nr:hypothetical protein [Defluviitaleaceae bacterium]
MLTFEESRKALTHMADSLPQSIYNELNGGILLLPGTAADDDELLILGQYHVEPFGMGRYITVYYGSMIEAFGHLGPRAFLKKLKDVLHHELVHHLEDLAGDNSLEIQDTLDIERYLSAGQRSSRYTQPCSPRKNRVASGSRRARL